MSIRSLKIPLKILGRSIIPVNSMLDKKRVPEDYLQFTGKKKFA